MDQINLDAMFDGLLGELDMISQQLETSSNELPTRKPIQNDDNRASSYSQSSNSDTSSSQSYSAKTQPPQVNISGDSAEIDIDLGAMLSDLTDWEHNLTSGQGQMPTKKSASQDSGIGFNGNSLPRNANLNVMHVEGSPKFSTLKRAAKGGPSVTFGDDEDDLSLQGLEKDMEQEKRRQDKSRQLSAEELAALSPVMQELDDLVNDLSNLSFSHGFNFDQKSPSEKRNVDQNEMSNGHVPQQTNNDVFNDLSFSPIEIDVARVEYKTDTVAAKTEAPSPSNMPLSVTPSEENDKQPVSLISQRKASLSEAQNSVSVQKQELNSEDNSNSSKLSPTRSQNSVLNAARQFETAAYKQNSSQSSSNQSKQVITNRGPPSPRQINNLPKNNHIANGVPPRPQISSSKPPVPPSIASKPKLPDKPQSINIPQRQRSITIPASSPKPAIPLKRQASVKAPANLSNILERQLLRANSYDDKQTSPTGYVGKQSPSSRGPPSPGSMAPPSPGHSMRPSAAQQPMGPPLPGPKPGSTQLSDRPLESGQLSNEHRSLPNRSSLMRQNSAEVRPMQNHTILARKHSASRTSVQSNTSTTSSVMSTKSNSSAESDVSRHSADYTMEKPSHRYSFAPEDIKRQLDLVHRQADNENLTREEREERIKAEKMRIALEKLKEARIQKLVVKVFNKDDSSKTLVVDERMTARSVVKQLLEKNHFDSSINWALIEELPSLFMERIFEEHESVTEMLSYWTRDTSNQVRFLERKDKYALFRNPQHYLLSTSDAEGQMAERQKQTLIEEFFSGRSGTGVPEVQGILYIKGDSKSWSRKYCVLRTSGLYCSKSGEPKKGKKVTDLQCLVMFEQICVYLGRGWKKKHKSPSDYGFALKHPAIQTKSKHIRYFCCDDVRSLMRWIVGIRCAKYGKQLKDNYDKTNDEMKGMSSMSMQFHAQQSDSNSIVSTDSGEAGSGSRQNTLPRATLSNVFEGAWQKANQQENAESINEAPAAPGLNTMRKSVWKPQQQTAKTNSNWWDLGISPQLEDLVEPVTDLTKRSSGISNGAMQNHRSSVGSTGSRGSTDAGSGTPTFVPPSPTSTSHPAAIRMAQPPAPFINKGAPPFLPHKSMHAHNPPPVPLMKPGPPPPLMKPGPPPPPMKPGPPPPPMKPVHPMRSMGFPPPRSFLNDNLPPPPPMDDLPPPPPMDDLPPPPPMDDDMPLPPPMELNSNRGLPKGLRTVNGQAPVRLPFLPMFKNGNAQGGFRGPVPLGQKPGPPPPPKHNMYPPPNHNFSNNKPPLLPREQQHGEIVSNQTAIPKSRTPSYSSHSLRRKPSNPNFRPVENSHSGNPPRPTLRAPLTQYYNSDTTQDRKVMYTKDDFPPPPDFVLDLKDTFHQVNYNNNPSMRDMSAFDFPPPPPELLLNEVKNRNPPQPPPKSAKPAPPPPRRSPSTRLSTKR